MHYYQFNPADFNNSARHLTLIERAIYRDLLDMYYCTEKAIDGSDDDALARRLLCKTEEHFEALRNVLDEFFTFDKRSKRYRNRRCETEIKNYRHKHRKDSHKGVTSDATDGHSNVTQNVTKYGVTMTAAERQQKLRQERKQMADDLVSIGVSVSKSLKTGELRALHAQHIEDIKQHVTKIVADNSSIDVTSAVTNRHKQCHKNDAQNGAITINQEPTTNNQLNNYNSSNSPVNEKFDVEFWQPSRTAIQPLVSVEVPAMPSMTQAEFDKHLSKFKKYRINQKTAEGEYIATEDYCTDLFVSWIKREYIHDQRNRTITAKPKVITQTSNRGYSSLGKAPLADDSDIPAAFFQGSISSSKPTQATKPSPKTSVTLNGCWFAPLPNMDVQETYTYIANQQDAGETQDETYKRVLDQMQEAV